MSAGGATPAREVIELFLESLKPLGESYWIDDFELREFVEAGFASLASAGYRLAPAGEARTVWTVNRIHSPSVSHGFDVVAVFSTQAAAERYRSECEAWQDEFNARLDAKGLAASTHYHDPYEVEEWAVDDPALMGDLDDPGADGGAP